MDWHLVDWDAIATFATGVLAVGAALFVGQRQTKLMRQQQRDSSDQHAANLFLQQQSLRIELLDRRSACIAKMRPLWSEYMTNSNLPAEKLDLLKQVLWDAQLIFSSDICKRIEKVIHSKLLAGHRLRTAVYYHQQGDTETATKWQDKGFSSEDQVYEAIWHLLDDMITEAKLLDDRG